MLWGCCLGVPARVHFCEIDSRVRGGMQFGMLFKVLWEVLVTWASAVSGGAVGVAGAQSSACFSLSGVHAGVILFDLSSKMIVR